MGDAELGFAIYPDPSVRSQFAEILHETLQRPLAREKMEWVVTAEEAIHLIQVAHHSTENNRDGG